MERLSIEEQLIWNRIANKAVAHNIPVSIRWNGLTKAERLELLRTLEYHLDNTPNEPLNIKIRKPNPWYKWW